VGNKVIPGKKLREELSFDLPSPWPWKKPPVYKPDDLAVDLDRIRLYYRKQGFYHARITSQVTRTQDRRVWVEIKIEEGPWIKLTRVEVKGADIPPSALPEIREASPLKIGERFTESNYEGLKRTYLSYFLDHGHPYAKIEGKVLLDEETNLAGVHLTVQPGVRCTFGEVSLQGERLTPDRVILRKLTFKPGDLYSLKELYESQRRLYALDLFQSVSLTPQEASAGDRRVPIVVEVQEKKRRSVKLGLGYGNEDQFRARLGLRWRNLAGGGRLLDLDAKYSYLETRLMGTLTSPQILTTHLDLVWQTGLVQQRFASFTDRAYFTQVRLERDLPQRWRLAVGHALEWDRPFNIPLETLILLGEAAASKTDRASMGIFWLRRDTTDNPIDPHQGGILSFAGEVAPDFFGSTVQFARAVAEARRYQSLGESKVVLAGRLKCGIIEPMQGTPEIPLYRRFFAGGANSVRGYRLDYLSPRAPNGTPIGGNALLEGSVEARLPIYKEFRAVAFLDFGNVYLQTRDIDLGQLRYASGFGLRYQTPVGPVGLDVGFPLNPLDPKQDTYRIYFTIGQTF
jgi:outer membrane protein assembly complex protein YaeT